VIIAAIIDSGNFSLRASSGVSDTGILLEVENVIGIVAPLDFHQPEEVIAVICIGPILERAIRDVNVGAAGGVGLHRSVDSFHPMTDDQ
jgi:hypothetical protein